MKKRFVHSVLVEELRNAETDEYRAVIITFINCLVARCGSGDERSNIRHELAGMACFNICLSCLNLFFVFF